MTMDIDLRKKALSRLARSESQAAMGALRDELTEVLEQLKTENEYDRLEDALSILEIFVDKFSSQATDALIDFIKSIEGRALSYSNAGALVDRISDYQNSRTLVVKAIDVLLHL